MNTLFKRATVVMVLLALATPAAAFANQNHYQTQYYYPTTTYYPQYSAQTTNQTQLAYLYSLIAQLQAQLAALQANPNYHNSTGYDRSDRVNAITEGVRVRDNEVVLEGRLDFEKGGRVRAWFEYGTNQSVSQSTQSVTVNGSSNGDKSISIPASVIKSHSTYYYRLVAEDSKGDYSEGVLRSFTVSRYDNDYDDDDDDDDDRPEVTTEDADDVDENSAELTGEVDMNDFEDGYVFLVYGEDEDAIEDVEDEDEYDDIDNDGDDLRKFVVDSSLDGDEEYEVTIGGLDEDTDYYFRFCVEYEDEDDDETLECGDVEEFTTDDF